MDSLHLLRFKFHQANDSELINCLPTHLLTQAPNPDTRAALLTANKEYADINTLKCKPDEETEIYIRSKYKKSWCFFCASRRPSILENLSNNQTRVSLRICTLGMPLKRIDSMWITLCHLISNGKMGCSNGKATDDHIALYCDWGEVLKIRQILNEIEDGLLKETKFEIWRLGEYMGTI